MRRRTYDETILDELIEFSDEGMFVDEMLARWGISEAEWEEWQRDHVELAELVPLSRARARATMLKTLRDAVKHRSAFPAGLADRMIALLDRDTRQDDGADGLVLVHKYRPADDGSADGLLQAIEKVKAGVTK